MQFQQGKFGNEPRPRFTQPTFVGLGLRFVSVVEAVEEGMEADQDPMPIWVPASSGDGGGNGRFLRH